MSVIRVEHNKNYTTICNYHLRDKSISLKAKGLLTYMLSLPEDWDYSISGLAKICKEGPDSIRSAINELEENGYMERQRSRNDDGTLGGVDYIVREIPNKVRPTEEQPTLENPTQVNQRQIITNNTNNVHNNQPINKNTNYNNSSKKFIPPTVEEAEQYCRECGFDIDAEYFVDYYTACGWMVGQRKMRDWKAAIRYWNKNQQKGGQSYGQPTRSSGQDANSRWGITPTKLG